MLYTLNINNFCPLDLDKAGEKKLSFSKVFMLTENLKIKQKTAQGTFVSVWAQG